MSKFWLGLLLAQAFLLLAREDDEAESDVAPLCLLAGLHHLDTDLRSGSRTVLRTGTGPLIACLSK
jgi:hypothetical protein